MIIYQRPNTIQLIALGFTALGFIPIGGIIHRLFIAGAVIAWSGWGYDEIKYGANHVRRLFGVIAILGVAAWLIHS